MGPLERELAESMRVPEGLLEQIRTTHRGGELVDVVAASITEVITPLMGDFRDAILRLAREVDELPEQRDH
jgi:hypothetical protein